MAAKFLDADGLAEVWEKVKERSIPVKGMNQHDYDALDPEKKKADVLYVVDKTFFYKETEIGSNSGTSFSTDSTLNMSEDNVLSVATPNKGIISQSGFNSLDEEEKNHGVYVIPGEEGGSFNPYFPEIYSEQETIIGRWIDGKPVYRRVIRGTSGNERENKMIGTISMDAVLVNVGGSIRHLNGLIYSINGHDTNVGIDGGGNVLLYITVNSLSHQEACVILEYTKTTDQGGLA